MLADANPSDVGYQHCGNAAVAGAERVEALPEWQDFVAKMEGADSDSDSDSSDSDSDSGPPGRSAWRAYCAATAVNRQRDVRADFNRHVFFVFALLVSYGLGCLSHDAMSGHGDSALGNYTNATNVSSGV
jgi:hypothetical protein